MNKYYKLGKIPFYWRVATKEDLLKSEIPFDLDFTFYFDPKLQLLKQKKSKLLINSLEAAYKADYNIGNIQPDNQWGDKYAQDFLDFIQKYLSKPVSMLEIGCGGGMLLSRFQESGHSVLGIDPAPLSKIEASKLKVQVISDFYPSKQIKQKFDVIYHSDVLEHVTNPLTFLKKHYIQLNNNGLLFISTPDCSENILKGDTSLVLHQHFAYFDKESLQLTLEHAGFKVLEITRALYGGSLYVVAQKKSLAKQKIRNSNSDKFNSFVTLSKKNLVIFTKLINEIVGRKQSIGIYAPIRALPYISQFKDTLQFRFFDDTAYWYGKYINGTKIKIENMADLTKNPVQNLFIMSLTFGEKIKQQIPRETKRNMNVITLSEILN